MKVQLHPESHLDPGPGDDPILEPRHFIAPLTLAVVGSPRPSLDLFEPLAGSGTVLAAADYDDGNVKGCTRCPSWRQGGGGWRPCLLLAHRPPGTSFSDPSRGPQTASATQRGPQQRGWTLSQNKTWKGPGRWLGGEAPLGSIPGTYIEGEAPSQSWKTLPATECRGFVEAWSGRRDQLLLY